VAYGTNQIDQYRKGAVTGASPLQLVIMLYDGGLRFMEAGKRAMSQGDTYEQNQQLVKAQAVIAELMSCLDLKGGSDVARNLLALYAFCYNRLVEANLGDEPHGIDECIRVLSELRDSWVQIETAARASKIEAGHAA